MHDRQVVYARGRVVGRIGADGWLEKAGLDPARHKMRLPSGWATDTAHLAIPGLRGVRLHLTDGTTLEAPIELWRRHGVPVNRGFGAQMVLTDEFWRARRPGEVQTEQLSFFGGGLWPS